MEEGRNTKKRQWGVREEKMEDGMCEGDRKCAINVVLLKDFPHYGLETNACILNE